MRSAGWPSASNFFGRGACRISEILQNVRAIFAQNFRDLDAGLARHLALERIPTRKRAAKECYALRATTLVEFTQLFCARRRRRAENLNSEILQFFSREFAVRRKFCVSPMLDACFFGSECNADSINSQRRCEACAAHAGRMHALFLCAGRAGFPEICNFFARILRKFCFISTLNSRVILH